MRSERMARMIARVEPLDIKQVRAGDSERRKGQFRRHGDAPTLCIVAGCCSVQRHDSVLCIAHGKGLGLL